MPLPAAWLSKCCTNCAGSLHRNPHSGHACSSSPPPLALPVGWAGGRAATVTSAGRCLRAAVPRTELSTRAAAAAAVELAAAGLADGRAVEAEAEAAGAGAGAGGAAAAPVILPSKPPRAGAGRLPGHLWSESHRWARHVTMPHLGQVARLEAVSFSLQPATGQRCTCTRALRVSGSQSRCWCRSNSASRLAPCVKWMVLAQMGHSIANRSA